MPDTARRYTVEEVLAFPSDGNRYELVHGELLVTPSPAQPHQRVAARFHGQLFTYLTANPGIAEVMFAPADITVGQDELVQPDVFVVPLEELGRTWKDIRTLLLVIEVTSPSSARYDRVTKRRFYQELGVLAYWIADHDAGLVEVWRPTDQRPEIVTDVLTWRLPGATEELRIDLKEVFGGL
jgi:Uma2 family endonuclease